MHRLLNACVAIMCVVKEVTVASKRALACHTPAFPPISPPFSPFFPVFPHFSPFIPIFPHFPHFPHFSVAQKRLGDSGVGDFQGLTTERHKLRTEVGLVRFRMIQAVQTLRRKLADPTPHQPPSPLWLTKYVARTLPAQETPRNLRNHAGAPMRSGTKGERRNEAATAEPMDPDQWIRDVRAANDDEALAWFTSMRATNTAPEEPAQKRPGLSVAAQQWAQYKATADRLIQEHARRTHDTYHSAHAAKVARQHLRTLHAYYTNALTAKTDYHMLVTRLLKDQTATQRLHDTHTHMYRVRRQWYEQAKYSDVVCRCKNVSADLRALQEDVRCHRQAAGPSPPTGTLHVGPAGTLGEHDTTLP